MTRGRSPFSIAAARLVLARLVLALPLLWTFTAAEPVSAAQGLRIGESSAEFNETTSVPLLLDSTDPVEGLVAVVEWDARKGFGVDVTPSAALASAEFLAMRVEPDYLIISAIIDTNGEGVAALPAGNGILLADASLRCICDGDRQEILLVLPPKSRHAIIDGGPVLQNTVVVGGRAIQAGNGLTLTNGKLVCNEAGGPGEGSEVTCGTLDENGNLAAATAEPGGSVKVCFFYKSPITEDPTKRIQGFQLAVSYDCQLVCREDSASILGTVLETLQAEFVQVQCDNDATDGDACELVAGVLIDVAPPFDGRTLPGTETFAPLFCVDYDVAASAPCGARLGVEFRDGLNGRGDVPIANLVSINNFDAPLVATACEVEISSDANNGSFQRGDCNFNTRVNVADAAALISHLFLVGAQSFDPPCDDACDVNDDGQLAVNDAMVLLDFLFTPGSARPPEPGPVVAGPDPTVDALTCAATDGACVAIP
jgi:hypothetical protein